MLKIERNSGERIDERQIKVGGEFMALAELGRRSPGQFASMLLRLRRMSVS